MLRGNTPSPRRMFWTRRYEVLDVFGGSIFANRAVNMDGVGLKRPATWLRGRRRRLPPIAHS